MGALYFITGSCGSGKSTLLAAVKAARPGLSAHHTDDMGVPGVEEMIARFGSTDAWQAHRAREWVERAAAPPG
jgi:ABC-type molybdenum transport system ATPase subunit/photorepair protein PhrA